VKGRKPIGHWDKRVVIQELYKYLIHIKHQKGRPSIWMPRPSELTTHGRDDLKQAIARFYGRASNVCTAARLVPYQEWRYFESQLELYTRLSRYLEWRSEYYNLGGDDENVFPKLVDAREYDERLYHLIQEFGGRQLLALKLDMKLSSRTTTSSASSTTAFLFSGMQFGAFDLGFAIRLMCLIRNEMYHLTPPMVMGSNRSSSSSSSTPDDYEKPCIRMLTRRELVEMGEGELADKVKEYGGYENVARRLGLEF